jgi:IclR family transcriptional regulator, pca regulon regulatory protein
MGHGVPNMDPQKRDILSPEVSNSSLTRGLQILESFTEENQNLSLAQIRKATGTPKSTAFRLLKILNQLNYLKCDPETKKYYLGPRVLSLGFSVLQSMETREIARPYMQELSRTCNKSVNLLMLDGQRMVFIERIRVPGLRDVNVSVGSRIPVYNTAAGRSVLAYLPGEKLNEVIEDLKRDPEAVRHIGKDSRRLIEILNLVRRDGFAINDQESGKGTRAIAVPIFSRDGIACAMDLIVSPEEVSIDELKRDYLPILIKTGIEISESLGYQTSAKPQTSI